LATSGSIDFTSSGNELIEDALRVVGVLDPSESMDASMAVTARRALNLMVKTWMGQGVHLFTNTLGYLFLAKSTESYSLGSSGWHATESYVETTTSAAAVSGAGSVTLTSATGITTGDNIGIELDDGTRQWTTATMSGTTATLGANLSGDVASGNSVFTYTNKIERPLRITEMRRYNIDDDIDTPVRLVTRNDYMGQTNKASTGRVIQAYYDPQLSLGKLYTWPASDTVLDILRFTFQRTLEDFDAAANTPDFPVEWHEAIKWNLAVRLWPEYWPDKKLSETVLALALSTFETASSFDSETESTSFGVDFGG
jgi:hypothetical protein